MFGFGTNDGDSIGTLEYATKQGKYGYLLDENGDYKTLDHVRHVFFSGAGPDDSGSQYKNEWLRGGSGKYFGPELGIGFELADHYAADTPIMLLKSCIGNRALGWDLLPPGSTQYEVTDANGVTWVRPGYKGGPERWKKGTVPQPGSWYAGLQYDGDTERAKRVLEDLDKYYAPGTQSYEVAGFLWWQGDRDSRTPALADRYERNLVQLIKRLRYDFNAPDAKFVAASLGQTPMGSTDGGGKILTAMLNVDGKSGKYDEFRDNVAAVYTHPFAQGGASGGHYSKNAEVYMDVGVAMGKAMAQLLAKN